MLTKSTFRFGLAVLFFVSLTGLLSFAQFSANIQGIVQDPSGAGVPKAEVTLTNTATHVSTSAISDGSGNYRFSSLAPGSYSVTAERRRLRQVPARCDFADRADLERAHHAQGRLNLGGSQCQRRGSGG